MELGSIKLKRGQFSRHCLVEPAGSFGALACFSTYTAHTLITGVGGLITTNDAHLARLCRSLVAHGRDTAYLSIDDDDGVSDNQLRDIVARRFSFEHLGFSYRMSELEGALVAERALRPLVGAAARRRVGLGRRLAGRVVGIVVDGVSDVTILNDDQIKPPPEMGTALNTDYLIGLGTLADRMLILIDIDKLMSSEEMGLIDRTLS